MGAILSCVVAAAAPRLFVPPGRDLVPMRSSSLPVERVALPPAVELKLPLLSEERELRQVPLSTLRGSCFYVVGVLLPLILSWTRPRTRPVGRRAIRTLTARRA